jgi:predicted acyl esterase
VAALPYVDGKVGMFGGSYLATTQLMAASRRPPHLVALFPSSSYRKAVRHGVSRRAFYLSDGLSWNLGQAADVRRRILTPEVSRDGPIGLDDREGLAAQAVALACAAQNHRCLDLRRYAPAYFDMLAHPSFDDYWRRFDIASRHDQFEVPASHHRLVRHPPGGHAAKLLGATGEGPRRALAMASAWWLAHGRTRGRRFRRHESATLTTVMRPVSIASS